MQIAAVVGQVIPVGPLMHRPGSGQVGVDDSLVSKKIRRCVVPRELADGDHVRDLLQLGSPQHRTTAQLERVQRSAHHILLRDVQKAEKSILSTDQTKVQKTIDRVHTASMINERHEANLVRRYVPSDDEFIFRVSILYLRYTSKVDFTRLA